MNFEEEALEIFKIVGYVPRTDELALVAKRLELVYWEGKRYAASEFQKIVMETPA